LDRKPTWTGREASRWGGRATPLLDAYVARSVLTWLHTGTTGDGQMTKDKEPRTKSN